MKKPIIARQLDIEGVVQGVGFRPFLYGLAKGFGLSGEVSNTAAGVRVVVEGLAADIDDFAADIPSKLPLLASVNRISTKTVPPKQLSGFEIIPSKGAGSRNTLISPDVSICPDCLKELQDPGDRRFEYPFINCTNCGPRFTIIEDIPYDRPKTSMKHFTMCDRCRKEYDDPMNRRFHAQPNACPECGPKVFLTDNLGREIRSDQADAVLLAARWLNKGKILGVKGLGGFHLACDASSRSAVQRLRQKKNRPHKPFALMARSVEALSAYVHVDEKEKQLLESWHRPIVLLKKRDNPSGYAAELFQDLAGDIARSSPCLGIMLPYTPLHYLLLEKGPELLVMTSGNRSGEPLSIENEDALDAFSHIADFFLLHNRDIYFRADDSIVRVQAEKTRFIRRSRGYAPLPVVVKNEMPAIVACGAGLKNTVCLTRGKEVFLSQHIGDLENIKSETYFQTSIAHLKQIFDIRPELIAHDMHPGYMSTAWAESQSGIKKIVVQHHHAHAVSCMAENHLDEPVIAVTLDGTGYGTDGNIWGGEILVCSHASFQRKAHLSYVHMPGGDKAVLEPWRMAASLLYAAYGKAFPETDISYIRQMDKQKLDVVCRMMAQNLNSPLTSSAGRVFDAVASLLCIRHEISYESQAAVELETLALEAGAQAAEDPLSKVLYPFDAAWVTDGKADTCIEIDMRPCVRQIVDDLHHKLPKPLISLKLHHTLAAAFSESATRISRETGIKKVVLSGGVFNNDIILMQMIKRLELQGFDVYTHSAVPAGDGGICLGQAVAAAAMEENKNI